MKRSTLWACPVLLLALAARSEAGVADDLKAAAAAGHPAFLVVTEGEAKGTDLALRVSAEAAQIVPDAVVVRLDRADPANASVVKRLRLESVQVPLILVVAANGVAAGATRPNAVTASRLARMVPGPSKSAYLLALDEGKPAFLVFAAGATPGRAAAVGAAEAAVKLLAGKAATVVVDLADPRETDLVGEMKLDAGAKAAVTVVMNARGQRTATFDTAPEAAALVEASKQVVEECCPGGRCK